MNEDSKEPGGTPVEPAGGDARATILLLFGSAALWLFLGVGLNLLASIKLHGPALLANIPFLTYGRVRAAQESALLYGFGIQAALGVSIWLVCRLRRTALAGAGFALIASLFWNLGVTAGIWGILSGEGTGFDSFEFPRTATPILFAAYVILALCIFFTSASVPLCLSGKNPKTQSGGPQYVSQILISSSILWFIWIFLSTNLLVLFMPVRGVLQNASALWYQQNLNGIVLTFSGLAAAFYFIPKLLDRPLYSRALALVAVWTLALFGTWGGLGNGAPFPRWMITLSEAGTALTAIPLLALAINFYRTILSDSRVLCKNIALRFFFVGLIAFFVSKGQEIIAADPLMSSRFGLTLALVAQKGLFFWGFLVMTLFGAIHCIFPGVTGVDWPSRKLVGAQFWCVLIGMAISYLANLAGGLIQGFSPNNEALMALRIATIGDLLLFLGVLAFLINLAWIISLVDWRKRESIRPNAKFAIQARPSLGIYLVMTLSWAGCVVFPILQLEGLQQVKLADTGSLYPVARTGLARQGAEIYRAQGCIACHTQQVRPGGDITRGLGIRRTVARDYIFDDPPMLGALRIGPDLSNVGSRLDAQAILSHLNNPKGSFPGSVMPPYKYLFDDGQQKANALAAYLASLKVGNILYETPNEPAH